MTLYDLTHREAGIIIYDDGSVAVANWLACGDDMVPHLAPFGIGMIPFPVKAGLLESATFETVDDFRTVLPGSIWLTDETDNEGNPVADTDLDIIHDQFNDLPIAFLDPDNEGHFSGDLSAVVYRIPGYVIIAPYMFA